MKRLELLLVAWGEPEEGEAYPEAIPQRVVRCPGWTLEPLPQSDPDGTRLAHRSALVSSRWMLPRLNARWQLATAPDHGSAWRPSYPDGIMVVLRKHVLGPRDEESVRSLFTGEVAGEGTAVAVVSPKRLPPGLEEWIDNNYPRSHYFQLAGPPSLLPVACVGQYAPAAFLIGGRGLLRLSRGVGGALARSESPRLCGFALLYGVLALAAPNTAVRLLALADPFSHAGDPVDTAAYGAIGAGESGPLAMVAIVGTGLIYAVSGTWLPRWAPSISNVPSSRRLAASLMITVTLLLLQPRLFLRFVGQGLMLLGVDALASPFLIHALQWYASPVSGLVMALANATVACAILLVLLVALAGRDARWR